MVLLREADITECQPDFVSGFQRSRGEERWWKVGGGWGWRGLEMGAGGRGEGWREAATRNKILAVCRCW